MTFLLTFQNTAEQNFRRRWRFPDVSLEQRNTQQRIEKLYRVQP